MSCDYPERIVCLTEETAEVLYLLGEEDRIVGISGFTVRPPRARREKARVSAFTSAKTDKIMALNPDLVLGFSDLQAGIASDLIRLGMSVHIFNQRSVSEIHQMILILGAMVGCQEKAQDWIRQSESRIASARKHAAARSRKPRVYFEEWFDPIISGIRWVSEIIEIAGGKDCFPELSHQALAKNRIIANPLDVVERDPEIVLGSWCGRKFRPEELSRRAGWEGVSAVKNQQVFEVKSSCILQPGPAALTDGLCRIKTIIDNWALLF